MGLYTYAYSLAKPSTFSRTAERFLCRTYAAPHSSAGRYYRYPKGIDIQMGDYWQYRL